MIRVAAVFNEKIVVGGGEISFTDLIYGLPEHSIQPVVFVPGKGEVEQKFDRSQFEVVLYRSPQIRPHSILSAIAATLRLYMQFKEKEIDIVHTNGARCTFFAGAAAKLAGIPCLWHVRVIERDKILDRIRGWLVDCVIVNSGSVATIMKPFLAKKKAVRIVYNGLDLKKFYDAKPVNLRKEFDLDTAPNILSVGRLTGWKNIGDLIEACRILKERNVQFNCLIVGEALADEKDYEQVLKELVTKYELTNVHFSPWRDDVPSVMKAASVFVLPSSQEAFGRVIIEAQASGCPVVATDHGGPAELINHEKNGLLVPVRDVKKIADAIERFLKDTEFSEQIAQQALQDVNKYSIEEHIRQIGEIYREYKE